MKIEDTHRQRILAVDDELNILEFYNDALCNPGLWNKSQYEFELVQCRQGDAALEAVKKAVTEGSPFAVIFLDLNLPPGPDGIWAGEQIRKIDPYVNLVMVTGVMDVDLRTLARNIPPENKILYVRKPFHIQEIRQFAVALSSKWRYEILLHKAKAELEHKVEELERKKGELQNVNKQLMETNNALSVLARNLELTRKESEHRVQQKTRMLILPIIERLQRYSIQEKLGADLNQLVSYIENLTSEATDDIMIGASLSPAELRIASMIRSGMTSMEIASYLCVSPATVKTHRRNIRKKLNLNKSKVNLRSYMQDISIFQLSS